MSLVDVESGLLRRLSHHREERLERRIAHLLVDNGFVRADDLYGRKTTDSESLLDGGLHVGIDLYENEVLGKGFELCGWIDFTV